MCVCILHRRFQSHWPTECLFWARDAHVRVHHGGQCWFRHSTAYHKGLPRNLKKKCCIYDEVKNRTKVFLNEDNKYWLQEKSFELKFLGSHCSLTHLLNSNALNDTYFRKSFLPAVFWRIPCPQNKHDNLHYYYYTTTTISTYSLVLPRSHIHKTTNTPLYYFYVLVH